MDLSPSSFHDMSILHTGGARSYATHATKTLVDMLDERILDFQSPFRHLQYLVYAPARRIRFQSEYAIRRTLLQAQPAMDAPGIQLPRWPVRSGEVCFRGSVGNLYGTQSRNLPRLSVSFGLRACLTPAIAFKFVGEAPQTLMSGFNADGQRVTTTEASRGTAVRIAFTAAT